MKTSRLINLGTAVLRARFLKKKAPLVVGWAITGQCNRSCAYCDIRGHAGPEMSTREVLAVVDALAGAGTVRISFTGGEPLMRRDMGEIINYVHQRGIETKINSNGALVPSRIDDLIKLDRLHLSLEGPQEIHDAIRGQGSFKEVMAAAETARSHGIKTDFAAVLTRINLDAMDFLLETARQQGGRVIFQPATPHLLGSDTPNDLVPDREAYRAAISGLIQRKTGGDTAVANSIPGLKHLFFWPEKKRIQCAGGWITCRIQPDGRVLYCSREPFPFTPRNCLNTPFMRAFEHLAPIACDQCWCAGRVDLNLAFSLSPRVLVDQVNSLLR